MLNTYAGLNAAQVKLIADALAEKFDNNQIHALFVALDGLAGSGGTAATTTLRGTVLQSAARANITPAADGTAVGTAFNDLLTKLRAAGILAP